jgi:hypothetical protein
MLRAIYGLIAVGFAAALPGCTLGTEDVNEEAIASTEEAAYLSFVISGDPQVVVVPPGSLGTSKIKWFIAAPANEYPFWIKVSTDGAPEQLFTKESDYGGYEEDAPWIQAGSSYVFRIRTEKTGGSIKAQTTIVGVAP